jgi:HJR/Mrr/RecB family endonuclease
VDYVSGKIYYWGDAKYNKEKSYRDFEGNKLLLKTFEQHLDGNYDIVPPILHFSKTESGKVVFNGLCAFKRLELTWYEDEGKPVKNYRCELMVLDEDEIEVEWLTHRVNCEKIAEINEHAPTAWVDYTKGRIKKIEVFRKEIKSREQQLPEAGTTDSEILRTLTTLTPTQFEVALVEMFRELPHVHHNIRRTRPSKDGGFDFFGEFMIPFPLGYKMEFLGEAKKYSRTNGVGPEKVSRLVARLDRGQYGIFVTTSYYTKQAQEEVLEDGYPVKLYNGIDIVNFLRELRLIDGGQIKKDWLQTITVK